MRLKLHCWFSLAAALLLVLPICKGQKSASVQELPIREWIAKLARKESPHFVNFNAVNTALAGLDSETRCEVFHELDIHGPHKRKYRIMLRLLQSNFIINQLLCSDWPPFEHAVKDALRLAYEYEDPVIIAYAHRSPIAYYTMIGDYGSAGMYGLIAKEFQEKLSLHHYWNYAFARYDLGFVLYHSREYEASIANTLDAIYWPRRPDVMKGDSLNLYYQMIAWNTVGMSYEKLEQYDSAFYAFDQALHLSKILPNAFWTGLVNGNKGNVYFKMGKLNEAAVLLQEDYDQSVKSGDLINAGNSLQLLAQIHAQQGKAQHALLELRHVHPELVKTPGTKANLYYAYSRVFKALDRVDSMDYYMTQYLALHDALETEATHARSDIVRMRIDNQASVHKIIVLNKERQRVTLIRNFTIILILLITASGFLYFNRQRLKMKLRQEEILKAKAMAEAAASDAKIQLQIFTERILEKTSLVEKLQEQLMQKELTDEQLQHISELSQHSILTDSDWEEFKSLFEKVYPGFFNKLKNEVPDITVAEQRMAALSKLRISPKEAATLLGISPNSVIKTRSRLKQRLNLEPEADLELYFAGV